MRKPKNGIGTILTFLEENWIAMTKKISKMHEDD
jgi:hypothetical protein